MQRYDVIINGVTTTVQLSDADAKARGLFVDTKAVDLANKAKAPANKSRAPRTKRNADA